MTFPGPGKGIEVFFQDLRHHGNPDICASKLILPKLHFKRKF
jgi:hypothetical protein